MDFSLQKSQVRLIGLRGGVREREKFSNEKQNHKTGSNKSRKFWLMISSGLVIKYFLIRGHTQVNIFKHPLS